MSGFRTTNFDAVAAASPLNREASTIRDGSGDLWDDEAKGQSHWKAPPEPTHKLAKGAPDYTGLRMGRLVVVRFHGLSGKSTPRPVWLVRCVCGDYEVRRAESIGKWLAQEVHPFEEPSCEVCRRVQVLQRRTAKPAKIARRKADEALLDRIAAGGRP